MSTAVVFIPLTQGKVTVIDFEDFDKVRGFKWHARKNKSRWYASRKERGNKNNINLHGSLFPEAKEIHHIDGDGLNNCRANLSPCSRTQNLRGFTRKRPAATSVFRGVSWLTSESKWRAQITVSGKNISLGRHKSEIEAARAYDAAARKYFGEFASPNFVKSISPAQMAAISRAEQYSGGCLYRHLLSTKSYWSELKTGWAAWYWSATNETIERMIERGLVKRIDENTVKIIV